MITAYDANDVVFPPVASDPSTFRAHVYAVKETFDTALCEERRARGLNAWEMFAEDPGLSEIEAGFYNNFYISTDGFALDTALDEKRAARGLNAWEMFADGTGLSEIEVGLYNNFCIPTDGFALDTALDEERTARGLNAWEMLDIGIIKNDFCTDKQEGIIAARSARGPLSAKLVSRRVSSLAEYFSKHEYVKRRIDAPSAVFFVERFEVQTPSDVAAILKKHQDLESAVFATLATEGAKITEVLGTQAHFKFKSTEAKTLKDERMKLRAIDRGGKKSCNIESSA